MTLAPLRVLVVDDSAYNRKNIATTLAGREDIEVVGKAGDDEALKLVMKLEPDVITLGLEMPKMDGLTCLRILMAMQPMPVIVISSFTTMEAIARVLGALDFVATPERQFTCDGALRDEILRKVLRVRESHPAQGMDTQVHLAIPPGDVVEIPTLEEAEMMREMSLGLRDTRLFRSRMRQGLLSRRGGPLPAAAADPVLVPGPAPPSLVDAVDEPDD